MKTVFYPLFGLAVIISTIASAESETPHQVDLISERIPSSELIKDHYKYMSDNYASILTQSHTSTRDNKDFNFKLVYLNCCRSKFFRKKDFSYELAEMLVLEQLEDAVNYLKNLLTPYIDTDYCSFLQCQDIEIIQKYKKIWIKDYIIEAQYDGGYVNLEINPRKFRTEFHYLYNGDQSIDENGTLQKRIKVDF